MGGLRQTPVRRARTGAPLSGAIHPSSGDLQWTIARSGGRPRAFSLARFTRQQPDQGDVSRRSGIHPAFPPPYSSRWLCEDPAFRLSIEPQSANHGQAVPETPVGVGSTVRRHRASKAGVPSLRDRAPPGDRTAIRRILTPERSTVRNTSDGLLVKMIVAIPISRPLRSPPRDDRRRVPPDAVGMHEKTTGTRAQTNSSIPRAYPPPTRQIPPCRAPDRSSTRRHTRAPCCRILTHARIQSP